MSSKDFRRQRSGSPASFFGLVLSVVACSVAANSAVADETAGPVEAKSHAAIQSLQEALSKGDLWGEKLAASDFARVPLTKDDAAKARDMLWKQHAARITKEREAEISNHEIKIGKHTMPFFMKTFGEEPKAGWSLWISMHGGGGAPKYVNDSQWENQKHLYTLKEGIYLAPRAPTDTWNLWHEGHIDTFFDRLIEDLIVLKHVDPNRVYIMGYSAGGDGVYQLGPRMADRWAAAAMMAGHPNDASWLGLRNVGFAIQSGGLDSAYNRNKIAKQWIDKLDELHKEDPKGYVHYGKIFPNKGHWMDREDANVLPWMAELKRNPIPDRVVWKQSGTTHSTFYWLAVPKNDSALGGSLTDVARDGQTFDVKKLEKVDDFLIRMDDRMLDLDQPVRVVYQGKVLSDRRLPRRIAVLMKSLDNRGDPDLMFDAEVEVKLPEEK